MMKTHLEHEASFASALRTFVRALLVVVTASAVCSLSACSFLLPSIGNTLNSELRPHESDGTAVVDFDEVFPGDWTELVFVCREATQDEMDAALGFEWPDSPNLESPGFLSIAILSDGEKVVEHYSFGQNDFEEDLYVTPCPYFSTLLIDGVPQNEPEPERALTPGEYGLDVALIDRASSEVEFTYNPITPGDYWSVSEAEFERLRNGG